MSSRTLTGQPRGLQLIQTSWAAETFWTAWRRGGGATGGGAGRTGTTPAEGPRQPDPRRAARATAAAPPVTGKPPRPAWRTAAARARADGRCGAGEEGATGAALLRDRGRRGRRRAASKWSRDGVLKTSRDRRRAMDGWPAAGEKNWISALIPCYLEWRRQLRALVRVQVEGEERTHGPHGPRVYGPRYILNIYMVNGWQRTHSWITMVRERSLNRRLS